MGNNINRDKKGDRISPDLPAELQEEIRQRWRTYVWHFKCRDLYFGPVDYYGQDPNEMISGLPKFELEEVSLFPSPDHPPKESWNREYDNYEAWLNHYFRDVLVYSEIERAHDLRLHVISRLVIPKNKLEEIDSIIFEFGLEKHRDFILFLLAKIQKVYFDEIEFHERPEEIKRIRNLPKEVQKLVTIIEYARPRILKIDEDPPPSLEQIRFSFATEQGHVAINDSLLIHSIIEGVMDYWNKGGRKDWKKQLQAEPNSYTENHQNKHFRPRLAKAFHQFFSEQKIFDLKGKKILDNEAYCIAKLFDVAGLQLLNKQGQPHDISIDRDLVISQVKAWCKRTELTPIVTHNELKPKFETLYKYFDTNFIDFTGTLQRLYDIGTAYTICDRFGIMDHLSEIAHLMKCLNQWQLLIGYQQQHIEQVSKKIPELKGLVALLKATNNPDALQSITLKMNDVSDSLVLESPLLRHLVLEAIRHYKKTHQEEFEWDLWESEIAINSGERTYSIETTGKLNTPEKRFLPRFCRSFYNYLLNEAPPKDNDWYPSKRYCEIIGACLQQSFVFNHQRDSESVLLEKVNDWLKLTEDE